LDSLLLALSQCALVLAYAFWGRARLPLAGRVLLGSCAALLIPALLATWMLLFGMPIEVGRLAAILSLGALAARLAANRDKGEGRATVPAVRWTLAIPFALVFGVQIVGASLKPESSIDGLLYHGPTLANIMSTGSLFGWSSANQYVFYTDLQMVTTALWLDLTEIVWMEDAVQAPFVPLAALAVYVLSSQTSRYQLTRAWLSSASVVAPVIWAQARVLYVDVAAGALLASGVALLVVGWRTRESSVAVVAALAFGGAMATKPSAVFAGAVCFGLGILLLMWARSARLYIAYGLAAVLAAAPFFLRNLVSFGNPFFPVATEVGPLRFEGIIDSSLFYGAGGQPVGVFSLGRIAYFAQNLWVGMLQGSPRWLYDPREGGFGRTPLFFAAVLAVFVVVVLLMNLARRGAWDRSRFRIPDLGSLVVLLSAVGITFFTPNVSDSRYVIASYLLLCGFGFSLFSILPQFSVVDLGFCLIIAAVVLGGIYRSEANMRFGVWESVQLKREELTYNTGIEGAALSYGNSFAWLRDTDCPRILAQTSGGLTPSGMPQEGLLTTYQYGLWGNNLCNGVTFVPISDPVAAPSIIGSAETLQQITGVDFIVANDRDTELWVEVLEGLDLKYEVVASRSNDDYFGVGQVVLEVVR
jgi:hypothetical protein